MTRDRGRPARYILAASALFAAAITAAHAYGLWINTTTSLPPGLWRETDGHGTKRGDVALLCLPDTPQVDIGRSRGYIAPGSCPTGLEVLLKPIVALPGDTVVVAPLGITVNGMAIGNSAPLTRDGRGRALAGYLPGTYIVPPDRIWIVSDYNPRSFDSRYFGPVPLAAVLRTARPLWVVGK